MTPTLIDDIVNGYAALLAERGVKNSTIKMRRYNLAKVLRELEGLGLETDPSRMGAEEVRAVAYGIGLKESTARQYVSMLTDLCDGYGNDAPRRTRVLWNRTEPAVVWITASDLRTLLRAAEPSERMALVLGAMAGLRCSEIADLRVDDIHRDTITVRGKGHGNGLQVEQPIPPEVRGEIRAYMTWRSSAGIPSTRLIVWPNGYRDTDNLAYSVYYRIRKLGDSVGVRVAPHALRRFYATAMYDRGVDLVTISKLMRHARIETTEKYIRRDRRREYTAIGNLASAFLA